AIPAAPGASEAAAVHGKPARFLEEFVALGYPHDQRIDAAQHGVYAIEMLDPGLCLPALGDVGCDTDGTSRHVMVAWYQECPRQDPAHRSIRAHDAVLDTGVRRQTAGSPARSGAHALLVVRVNGVGP